MPPTPSCRKLVVSVWSARTPERCRQRNHLRVVPQVSALQPDQDRTPKAGVGLSSAAGAPAVAASGRLR